MNLEDLASWWHESLASSASDRTRKLYLEAVLRLISWHGTEGIPDKRKIQAYFAAFRRQTNQRTGKPLSPGYINQHWRSLQQFYRWLASEELIDGNPFGDLKQPTIPDSPVEVFSDDELARLFMATTSKRDKAILRVLLDCGVRVGELCGIEKQHVDFNQKRILVTGKGSHARHVPFGAKTYTELRRYLLTRPATSTATAPGSGGRAFSAASVVASSGLVLASSPPA